MHALVLFHVCEYFCCICVIQYFMPNAVYFLMYQYIYACSIQALDKEESLWYSTFALVDVKPFQSFGKYLLACSFVLCQRLYYIFRPV